MKDFVSVIAVVTMNESIEVIVRNELEKLSENRLSLIHRPLLPADNRLFTVSNPLKFQIV